MKVFGTLAVMTVLTVAVSYLSVPVAVGVALAMVIALFKGTLVGAYFMHLAQERKALFSILILCVVLFFALLLLPVLTTHEMAKDPYHYPIRSAPATAASA